MQIYSDSYDRFVRMTFELISSNVSRCPEGPYRAADTLQRVRKFVKEPSEWLESAALGGAIAISGLPQCSGLLQGDETPYQCSRRLQLRSADEIQKIMEKCEAAPSLIDKTCTLIRNLSQSEQGGDVELSCLRDASAMAFFNVVLPYYLKRLSKEETKAWANWEFKRLSHASRAALRTFKFLDPAPHAILKGLFEGEAVSV